MPSHRRMMMAAAGAGILPSDIANLWAWYRGDDVNDTGGAVDQWNDKSGNARHLTSAGGARPTLLAAEVNGKDAIDFDGSDDQIGLESLTLAQPIHAFSVFRQNTWTEDDRIYSFNDATELVLDQGNSGTLVQQFTPGVRGNRIDPGTGTFVLSGALFDGNDAEQFKNDDAPVSDTNIGTGGLVEIYIGSNGAGQWSDITMAELVLYSATITGDDLTSLKNYFNTRYNLW